ncbi:MAG: hypothetical protein Q8N03_07110 [Ignavibacteria bacterium]|nr:hypothetical protein [Ignavibacteria bacterium]
MQNHKTIELLPIFNLILSGRIGQREINSFVEYCYRLAVGSAKHHLQKNPNIYYNSEIKATDLAVDAVADLFSSGNESPYAQLISSYNNWQPEIRTEEEAAFFINSLVIRKVYQQYQTALSYYDPFYTKILHSVDYLIKKENCIKDYYLGSCFICKVKITEINTFFIDDSSFEVLPASLFIDRKMMLQNIFSHLSGDLGFYPAIPMHPLIQKIKHIDLSDFVVDECGEINISFSANEVIESSIQKTITKLEQSYVQKGKISLEVSEIFKRSLFEMGEDLKDGGLKPNLYYYVEQVTSVISKEEFHNKYHNIFEYLTKIFKQNIAEELKQTM